VKKILAMLRHSHLPDYQHPLRETLVEFKNMVLQMKQAELQLVYTLAIRLVRNYFLKEEVRKRADRVNRLKLALEKKHKELNDRVAQKLKDNRALMKELEMI
jgi:hypothetical protein